MKSYSVVLLGKKPGRSEEFGGFTVEVSGLRALDAFFFLLSQAVLGKMDDDLCVSVFSSLGCAVWYALRLGYFFELLGVDNYLGAVAEFCAWHI